MKATRRDVLRSASIGVATASLLPPAALRASATEPKGGLAAAMASPPKSSRPQLRWWWPGGTIEPGEVRKEVGIIDSAGFGGFEIADVRDSITVPIDPKTHGWASPAWIAGMEAALEEALRQGISLSLTLGPHWPTGIPGVMPDDDAASKEMVHGLAALQPGERFSGAVPSPVLAKPSGALPVQNENPPVTAHLLAVQAFRVVSQAEDRRPVLDPSSMVDLTATVRESRVDWQAPEQGKWLLMSFWTRGTGQIQNMFGMNKTASMLADPTPYVLDIYGPAGVQALTKFWDTRLLTPKARDLMRQTGGTFFEDSLEMSAACAWTPSAVDQFAKRRGYDLAPYLALLASRPPTMEDLISGVGHPQLFEFEGVDAERVRHDFDSMMSEMYVENHIGGITAWANSLGAHFRVQAVGSEINSGYAAAFAEVPEGDNSNDIHGWRSMAAGRDIGGHKILSDEAGTFVKGIAHVATWRDLLYMLQRDMAGGVNQFMIHGFDYATAPGASWPGFSAFGRSIGNDWGPRDPNWTMAPGVTAYLGRLQHLMRQGRTQADLAVLGKPLRSQTVLHAGLTFQYPAMELFDLPQMKVTAGRLMIDGPAYKAVVVNALDAIDVSVARKLLAYSEAGLAIVFVGDLPGKARTWKDAGEADAAVARAIAALVARPNVARVSAQKDVPAALRRLGIEPDLHFSNDDRVLALHRRAGDQHFVYLLNDEDKPTAQDVTFAMPGTAYQLDLWNGTIRPWPGATTRDGKITVPLTLAPDEPTVVIVSQSPLPGAGRAVAVPARYHSVPVGAAGWQVTLDDWRPGAAMDEIRHVVDTVKMDTLVPWTSLPDRKGMAGTARYAATCVMPAGAGLRDAEIDLGKVEGTATVSVNGSPALAVNPFTSKANVGRWLRPGRNRIEIVVASPLNNRLLAEGIENQGFKPPVGDDKDKPPPPPEPPKPTDLDLADGPASGTGMQPGAAPPGTPREYMESGLIGPVTVKVGA